MFCKRGNKKKNILRYVHEEFILVEASTHHNIGEGICNSSFEGCNTHVPLTNRS